MNRKDAIKFLRFLKKPITENELNDFYEIIQVEIERNISNRLEKLVKQVACGYCKDCKFWNDKSAECTNDIIWLNSDMQTKKTKRSKTFYNISDLKTNLNFGCIRFESKPSV